MRFHPLLFAGLVAMTGGADARGCFVAETVLPQREAVLAKVNHGGSGRDLIAAVFDGDADRAARMLAADPRLKDTAGGALGDLLSVAIARCDKPLVTRLLAGGVPADGPPGSTPPLILALRATEPWFAATLLAAGASPNRESSGGGRPIDSAILLNSMGAVDLLLDHGAQLDNRDSLGATPLLTALDAHAFAIAEHLIARGADPWAADKSGGTLGWSVTKASVALTAADEAAFRRLRARLPALGWPSPAPPPAEVRALAAAGKWPPARARH